MSQGSLYIVATPIGNLGDFTFRAVEVLKTVDLIAAEDTRHSRVLLEHYGIKTPLFAVHEHNEIGRIDGLLHQLQAGKNIALISDAGTPLISDPGFPLVRSCRAAGVDVVTVPGACALIAALSASGLPTDRFEFMGFLPAKQQARETVLKSCIQIKHTLIFYEAPRRIKATLQAMQTVFAEDRTLVLARELTKQFETFLTGTASELLAILEQDPNQERGEMVLMVQGYQAQAEDIPAEALALLELLSKELPPKTAAKIVAQHYQLKAKELYTILLEQRS